MDQNTRDVLIAVIPASIALVGTIWVSWRTNVANRRHTVTARWWELKAKTYTDIIRALADLEFVLFEWDSHFTQSVTLNKEYQDKLARVRTKAEEDLKILGGTAPVLITERAAKALRRVSGVMDVDLGIGDVVKEIHTQIDAVRACREELAAIAKEELKH